MRPCASYPMMSIMSGINSSTALWYISRATGVVALLLMTVVLLLGLLVSRRGKLPGLPRFAVAGLHRNLSLIAVVFVALHVLTAVTDGYVDIPLTSAIVPLTSSYERLWLALGAVSLDLSLAVIVTSLVRGRIGRKTWKAVHWLAYLSWPIAWLHSYGAASDLRHGWMFALTIADLAVVVAAVGWRVAAASRDIPRAQRVSLLMSTVHQRGRSR
jgi:sulfoxide reductase heme-binding subunit YedZ